MGFDFDKFVSKPCMKLFGVEAKYSPLSEARQSFQLAVDFHESYEKVELEAGSTPITSHEVVAFVRLALMPETYRNPLQGDKMEINGKTYEIIDVRAHIPGCVKAVLHVC